MPFCDGKHDRKNSQILAFMIFLEHVLKLPDLIFVAKSVQNLFWGTTGGASDASKHLKARLFQNPRSGLTVADIRMIRSHGGLSGQYDISYNREF